MGEVRPIPTLGAVVQDVRGGGRALRVSWHREDGLVVLSLWHGPRCTATVRVAAADVPALVEALQVGLRPPLLGPPPEPIARPESGPPEPSLPEQSLPEPGQHEPSQQEPGQHEPGQHEPDQHEPDQPEGPEDGVAG